MKLRIFAFLMVLILVFSACSEKTPNKPADSTTTTENNGDNTPQARTDFRVLLSSDIHCTFLNKWYGLSNEDRMEHWVNSVLAEHERHPIDLIIFPGDLSLDHWGGSGSFERWKESTTKEFIEKYASRLPADIPKLYLPGNHEAYNNEQWKEITGNDYYCSYVLGTNLFIGLDAFGDDSATQGDYKPMNVEFIKSEMEKYPNTNVFLVAHYFDMNKESAEFKKLLGQSKRIVGLFQGHVHRSTLHPQGTVYGNLTIAQTGHFAFSDDANPEKDFWGFRDIVITEKGAVSSYIQVSSHADVSKIGKFTDIPRTVQNVQNYGFRFRPKQNEE